MVRWLLLVAPLGCLGPGLLAAELAQTDVERIPALVENLVSEDFQAREDAFQALKTIGPAAWPLLEKFVKDADAERVARIRKLARGWGILTEDQKRQAEEICPQLFSEVALTRAAATDALLAMGRAGIDLLKERLSSAEACPEAKLELSSKVVLPADKVTGKITLTNTGKGALWLGVAAKYSGRCKLSEPFGEPRPRLDGLGSFEQCVGGGRRLIVMRGYINPIFNWVSLLPDKAREFEGEAVCPLGMFGRYIVTYSTSLEGGSIRPRIDPGSDLIESVEIPIGQGLPKDKSSSMVEDCVFYLPDLSKESADAPLRLDVAAKTDSARVHAMLEGKVAIKALAEGKTVVLEENLVRYAWYALLDAKGVPVRFGSLRSILAEADDKALAFKRLKKGEQAEFKLSIPMPAKPGKYSMLVYYEAWSASNDGSNSPPNFGEMDAEDASLEPYKGGRLWSKIEPFEVKAEPAPEARK